jgi:dTDP-4-dehydrorhamnose reductase
MRVLLTGAGGQLGRDLQRRLNEEEVEAREHSELDITDLSAVLAEVQRVRPDWIINAAAFNEVDAAESREAEAYAVNADGPANLAKAAGRWGAAIVHVSTDYVFDGAKGSAYTEEDQPGPINAYGRSKLAGEQRVLESRAEALVVRTAWLYGRHGKNFVSAIRAAAARGERLRVVADQVGSPTATADLADAVAGLIRSPLRGMIHAVNAGACSRYEFARAIVGTRAEVEPIASADASRPALRPKNSALRSIKWSATGLPEMRPWQEALKDFLSS